MSHVDFKKCHGRMSLSLNLFPCPLSIMSHVTMTLCPFCVPKAPCRMSNLRIDKGSLGAVVLLDTYIHHYTGYVGISCIL